MKKKIAISLLLATLACIVICTAYNIYKWIVCGNQRIRISSLSKAYSNSDLYVTITAQDYDTYADLETKSKVKLLDSDEKKVKDVSISYDGNTSKISIPEVEAGHYILEATVSSKAGKDTVQKDIYISNGKTENITISIDKGIYKPRRCRKL